MPKTITIDSAELHEARVSFAGAGARVVQLTFSLLSGQKLVKMVNLRDVTADLKPSEATAADQLMSAMMDVLIRLELT